MIIVDFNNEKGGWAEISTNQPEELWGFVDQITNLSEVKSRRIGSRKILIPWSTFSTYWDQLKDRAAYHKEEIRLSKKTEQLITRAESHGKFFGKEYESEILSEEELADCLIKSGFQRKLLHHEGISFQARNVAKLFSLPSGATFSVPGAGKTTEALALFFLKRNNSTRLLVVCPKNAFGVWEQQINECAPAANLKITRLVGNTKHVSELLQSQSDVFLITYQKFHREVDNVETFVNEEDMVFLDESHYIKGQGVISSAVRSISHIPGYKLLMSGTPMPNRMEDLIPQFQFLFPFEPVDAENVVTKIRSVYVRTTKKELPIPKMELPVVKNVELSSAQKDLYSLVSSEEHRQLRDLKSRDANALRRVGKSAMTLLQIASNPELLANHQLSDMEPLIRALSEGQSRKVSYACKRARQLANDGRKCVIWSSFRSNVEQISACLADLGAVYIHGGVDAGDEDDDFTREGIINRFHDPNEEVYVLVGNPAACAEAISLHTVCHDAIYVDRTFNAAHYLQSIDRIHRIGLAPAQKTRVEILCSKGTIDEVVQKRLKLKIDNMQKVLNDDSIHPEVEEVDVRDEEIDEDGLVFSEADCDAYIDHLGSNG